MRMKSIVFFLIITTFSYLLSLSLSVFAEKTTLATTKNATSLIWKDCGSKGGRVLDVYITPREQYLGKPWTIFYTFVPSVSFTRELDASAVINVTLNGKVLHSDNINICDPQWWNWVAKTDGFGRCPYQAGANFSIHDKNTVPNFPFLPLGPYHSVFKYVSKNFKNGKEDLMCVEFNQTYAGRG